MRWIVIVCVAFSLGTVFLVKSETAGQDKEIKKQEQVKESLVKKHHKDGAKIFTDIIFKDFKESEAGGKKLAEEFAQWLNKNEEDFSLLEKFMQKKDEKIVQTTKELLRDFVRFIDILASDYRLRMAGHALRFSGEEPIAEYRIEWSPKGQWIVKTVKKGFA